jgi:precorrin-2 dehydrogenase / sirohydrochlorin ferrochelatase
MGTNYPVVLSLTGKKVVVVGGGMVADRKVAGLLDSGATITVVSPDLTEGLERLVESGVIEWRKGLFTAEDMENAFMVFATTNDSMLNQTIKLSAKPTQLVNIADDPDGSDFHVPARIQRGRLSITVSTDGASPILAKKIREDIENDYGERYESYLDFLFDCRQWILSEVNDPGLKRKLLTAITEADYLEAEDRETKFKDMYKKKNC